MATKARDCLLRSAPRTYPGLSISSGIIGNGKVREILTQKKAQQVLNRKVIKRVEETITETLFHAFRNSQNKLTVSQILEVVGNSLCGFDKYLTKGIIKQLAVFNKGTWALRDEFRNIAFIS